MLAGRFNMWSQDYSIPLWNSVPETVSNRVVSRAIEF